MPVIDTTHGLRRTRETARRVRSDSIGTMPATNVQDAIAFLAAQVSVSAVPATNVQDAIALLVDEVGA